MLSSAAPTLEAPPPHLYGWYDVTQVVLATAKVYRCRHLLSHSSPASQSYKVCIHVHICCVSPCLFLAIGG